MLLWLPGVLLRGAHISSGCWGVKRKHGGEEVQNQAQLQLGGNAEEKEGEGEHVGYVAE